MPQARGTRRFSTPSMAPLRPRSMLFTLYGDYVYPFGTGVRLSGLVEIGAALGLSESAMRSAVARLARADWIVARKAGNRSHYALTAAGRRLLLEGTQRIYRPRRGAWRGTWCVLTYSIPEASRALRDRVRKQLAWLGFGPMGGGAYVSPRDVARAALALAGEHRVGRFARIFSGTFDGPGGDRELAAQCWDLPAIARRYRRFIAHYEPLYRRDRQLRARRRLSDVDAFRTRFALTHDFRRFPFVDPDLPATLLPKRWPGLLARRLFEAHHALLRQGALRFFRRVASA